MKEAQGTRKVYTGHRKQGKPPLLVGCEHERVTRMDSDTSDNLNFKTNLQNRKTEDSSYSRRLVDTRLSKAWGWG